MRLLTLFLCLLFNAPAFAADLPDAHDPPLLKRFAGSEIVGYLVTRFDEYRLQTSTYKRLNLQTRQREYVEPPLKLEGAITRLWYEAAGATSSTELFRNYRNEIEAAGFTVLYDSTEDPAATRWNNFTAPIGDTGLRKSRKVQIFTGANKNSVRTLSAHLARPEGDAYVSVTTVDWAEDVYSYQARRGAYAAVDLIEVQPMEQQMVVVEAEEMAQSIAATGRIALYGILFDTNSAAIKAESRPALEQIAKLLHQEAALRLHVVGHTDEVGGFDFNMDLSRKRAESVVAALVHDHGIEAGRLTANGVAYLAPVASNGSEAGRARNRRVELVPQ